MVPILVLISLLTTPIDYSHSSQASENRAQGAFDHSYSSYNALLNKYVKDAKVDYGGFLASRNEFELFLQSLGDVKQSEYEEWSHKEKLAYWINAYNAFTIKAIIDHYPITRSFSFIGLFVPSNSILQIKGVWDKLEFRAVGRELTLGDIEHEILRKEFNEPRIHTAINCASIGCPDLRSEAYTADRLDEQLTDASINFVNNPEKGFYIDPKKRKVKYSKIFHWFGEDFIQNYGDGYEFEGRDEEENAVLNFALVYLQSEDSKEYVRKNKFKIGHLDYDWHLNEQETDDK
ncbi:MAG: DUF547 domain-containing protein [Deltaproteobacteria bacterium]